MNILLRITIGIAILYGSCMLYEFNMEVLSKINERSPYALGLGFIAPIFIFCSGLSLICNIPELVFNYGIIGIILLMFTYIC